MIDSRPFEAGAQHQRELTLRWLQQRIIDLRAVGDHRRAAVIAELIEALP